MHGLLYVTASTLTDQLCDHDMLLRQSKGSCDNCVTTAGYMRYDYVNSSMDVCASWKCYSKDNG